MKEKWRRDDKGGWHGETTREDSIEEERDGWSTKERGEKQKGQGEERDGGKSDKD